MSGFFVGFAVCAIIASIFGMVRRESSAEFLMRLVFSLGLYTLISYFIQ